jgi:methylated-DNA-[protein]-cysteine S-methyltransferase|tara:strand:+ start:611 stop:1108 length:498 start_codon:yes stop_codon:yes gene_type:complete
MKTYYTYHETSIGSLLLAGQGDALSLLGFPQGKMQRRHESGWQRDDAPFRDAMEQLNQYFAGELDAFDLRLAPSGTDFQRAVWKALMEIPYGDTWSYGQVAEHIDRPKASRAVGAANGVNPIPVIIPCHRVIGSSGKLTGFGGGLETKEYLLGLESQRRAPSLFS